MNATVEQTIIERTNGLLRSSRNRLVLAQKTLRITTQCLERSHTSIYETIDKIRRTDEVVAMYSPSYSGPRADASR